jgi:hypothetical protein
MNLVDLIAGQLSSGDVLGKLGGLIGANEAQTKTATTAAVPALLNVFSKLASTNSGADQLAKAMGGLDLGMLGNLAGALGGSQASGLGSLGGNLLGSLLGGGGGNNLSSLVGALASFAGMQPGIMKTLLTYLAPIVLGMVAKQFTGKPDAAGISRLFSEQSANIRGGLPKGFSLPDLALGAVSGGGRPSEPARSHGHAHGAEKAGMPGWLLPLLVLGALGVGYYLWNQNQKKAQDGVVAVREDVAKKGPVTVDRTEVIEKAGKDLIDTVTETIAIDPKFLEAGKVAGGLFTGLTKALGGVTDEASAKAALPEFEKFGPMLTTLEAEADKLPADEKPAFAKVIANNLGLLGKIVEKVMAIPGVRDVLGPVVTPMIETLTKMSK